VERGNKMCLPCAAAAAGLALLDSTGEHKHMAKHKLGSCAKKCKGKRKGKFKKCVKVCMRR
jgi:hypothetical protein